MQRTVVIFCKQSVKCLENPHGFPRGSVLKFAEQILDDVVQVLGREFVFVKHINETFGSIPVCGDVGNA